MAGYPINASVLLEPAAITSSSNIEVSQINSSVKVDSSQIQASSILEASPINASVSLQSTSLNHSTRIEVGQSGPQGLPGSGSDTITVILTNADSVAIQASMAVALTGSGTCVRATKVTATSRRAYGVAQNTGDVGAPIQVVVLGVCDVLDWTPSTGASWLAPNSRLMLGIDGAMTNAPSASPGEFHQEVARVSGPYKVIVNPSSIRKLRD